MSRSVTSTCLLNTSRDGDSTTSLGSLFQCLTTLSVKKFFPNIQSEPPLMQLEAIASCPVGSFLGEETNTLLITTTFHVIVENNKVSPQPPPLHTKQPQSPPTLLIRLVLQTLHQLLLFPAVRYDVCLQPVPSVSRVSPAWKRRAYTPKLGA